MARTRRLKYKQTLAAYHCISRVVNGEKLFGDTEKEKMRELLHLCADFCGVQVVTYVLMSNHFHVLVRVPEPCEVSDAELLRRFKLIRAKPTPANITQIAVLEATLKAGGAGAEAARKQLLKRMGDVSAFMKEFKERYSMWHNKTHKRYGTLWADRFSSTLVQADRHFGMETVAAYIDLNPVRVGLAQDPKDYRFCGYAEAEAVGGTMLKNLRYAVSADNLSDKEMLETYRVVLFGKGASAKRGDAQAARISEDALKSTVAEGGKLSVQERIRLRVDWLAKGLAFGGKAFVEEACAEFCRKNVRKRMVKPVSLSSEKETDWPDDLFTMRK
ncbi:MAG: transposase [Puniceicoccales bacterium]|jgi:REP element-mobilizing transposase RayT|nr:transposase [Puniceicoccales bacterium]